MVFECYPLITVENAFDTLHASDETTFLDGVICDSLRIDIISAFLDLDSLKLDTTYISHATELQAQAKWEHDSVKINIMNQRIVEEQMYWRAGRTGIVEKYFYEKEILFGVKFNILGFDYYKGGVYEMINKRVYIPDITDLVGEFDWRNRHGANNENSPYYDGDENIVDNRTGWITPIVDQHNCYSCWFFSAVAATEAYINLYFNSNDEGATYTHQLDLDLSELEVMRCLGPYNLGLNCLSPGNHLSSFNEMKNDGVHDDDCFSYEYYYGSGQTTYNPPCSLCYNPTEYIKISDFSSLSFNNNDDIKRALIKMGPLSCHIPYMWHFMLLVGYKTAKLGDTVYHGTGAGDPDIVLDEVCPFLESTEWIFKNSSWGGSQFYSISGINYTEFGDIIYLHGSIFREIPIEILCSDEDEDGYYWWGIHRDAGGNQIDPFDCGCPYGVIKDQEDCNDWNKYEGYYDEDYGCLENCNYDPNNPEIIYSSPIAHWETDRHFNRDLIIKDGATVTVLGATLWMGPDAKIIIERGGKLIMAPKVHGGDNYFPRITAGCGEFWQGIEVWGNSNETQLGDQGVLELDHATIEKMSLGIRNFKPDWNEGSGWATYPGYSGGIIQGRHSTFRDNKQAVVFAPYTIDDCASYFIADTFETHGLLLDGSYAQYFVVVNGTHGENFGFSNCTFRENGSPKRKTIGIYAYNSEFSFDGGNPDPLNPNQENFIGLNYGIYAFGNWYNPDYQIEITNSWFESNRRGIYLSGITYERIRNNAFQIPNVTGDTCYGLYLDHSTQWNMITENVFQKPGMQGQRGHIGIYVYYCGGDPKQIYKNSFQDLDYGTIAFGANRDDEGEGLVYRCNDFSDCLNDMVILEEPEYPEGGINETRMGIAYHQGTLDNPAGNTFTAQNICDYNIFNGAENNIRYVVPSDYLDYPNYYPFNVNSPVKVYRETGLIAVSEINCDPLELDYGRDSLYETRQELNEEIDSLTLELNLLVDGGNTAALNTTVITSIPPQALQVYDELMLKSPSLSDSVMNSSILKEEVLNNAFLRDILVANPQAAKQDSLMDKLDERLVPMPDTMKAEIMEGIYFLSAKEILEATIQEKHSMERHIFGRLIFSLCHDSLVNDPLDSLKVLFTNDESLSSKYLLAFIFLKSGMITGVDSVLTSIPSVFILDNLEQEIHQGYLDLFNVLTQLDSGNIFPWYLNSTQTLMLEELAQNDTILPGVLARNLLQAAGKLTFSEQIILPFDSLKSIGAGEQLHDQAQKKCADKHWVKVYPNPARDYYVIEYMFYSSGDTYGLSNKEIEIYSLSGVRIVRLPVTHYYNQLVIRCESYSSGIYLCSLRTNGRTVATTKFIITQ